MKRKSSKRSMTVTLPALVLILLAAGCSEEKISDPLSSWDETYGEDLERWVDADGARLLDAATTNGMIRVDGVPGFGHTNGGSGAEPGGAGTRVYVRVRKEVRAPSLEKAEDFAREVEIRTIREGDVIRVDSEYPEPPTDVQVMVSFEMECPREIDLNLHTVNGACRVDGMTASVQAATTNGGVEADLIDLTGGSRFTTVNGSIEVEIHDGIAPLTGSTLNGSVSLSLHPGFGGVLDAQTANGEIHCDFPIRDSSRHFPNQLTGTLGTGGSTPVTLSAVNGNIYLNSL